MNNWSNNQPTKVEINWNTPLAFLLFLVFLIMKLDHTIDWSWWWITAPLWGSFALFLVGLLVVSVVALFFKLFDRYY